MFDLLEPKRSRVRKIALRAVISLAIGAILTFGVNAVLAAAWSHLQDEYYQPYPFAVALVRILNLPVVIYCRYFTLPAGLPRSDESLYCWAVGFLFNIIYYAIMIFLIWSFARWLRARRGPRDVSGLPAGANG
jgi:hypothetical protein